MPPASPPPPSSSKKSRSKSSRSPSSSSAATVAGKPKNQPLCEEHLKFAQMVLKAGLACTLHDGEECESTAMCVERVAADLMGLTSAVAIALKRELKEEGAKDTELELVRRWCEFYSEELLPDTKKFVKRTSAKLDAYGMYLPSRMSASLPQELLERGLNLGSGNGDVGEEEKEEAQVAGEGEEEKEEERKKEKGEDGVGKTSEGKTNGEEADISVAMSSSKAEEKGGTGAASQGQEDEYDEYEYDEYDEYDDE